MNRDIFFAEVRREVYGGKSLPFETIDEILRQGQGLVAEHLAYAFATAYHEAGADMVPKRENLNYTKASRIREVWPSRFPTIASATPYVRQPQKLANKVYGGRLGNTKPNDGWLYRGAGLAQITFFNNFKKFGLEKTPEKALELPTAVDILLRGLQLGMFTGKRLSNYDLPRQFADARAIVNGDVKANGEKIAITARQFLAALRASGYTILSVTADPELHPELTPEVTEPADEIEQAEPSPEPAQPEPSEGWTPALTVPEYLDIIETSVAAVRKLLAEK